MMKRLLPILPVFALALAVYPGAAHAASLSVVSDAAAVSAGDTFGATVYLDTGDTPINASDGTLSFSTDLLKATSVAYGNSIFTLWAQEPSIDNINGAVSWSGGSSAPFSGSHGRVLRVTFLAKKPGTVVFSLPSSSIYASDGLGTNVATASGTASVAIASAPAVIPVAKPVVVPAVAQAPATPAASSVDKRIVVTSSTDPSQDGWYASNTAALAWEVPASADAVETVLSAKGDAVPSVVYRPAITQKTVDSLTDGVWYFNIRGHYASGWGPVTSYRLQIDSVPPTLSNASVSYDATSTALSVFAVGTDAVSGIHSYTVIVDDAVAASLTPADVADGSYRVPVHLATGAHIASIRATDNAGNKTDSRTFTFIVPAPAQKPALVLSLFSSMSDGGMMLFLALLLSFFSIGMNIILWMRVRVQERRFVRDIDVRQVRSHTLGQLVAFEKEIAREIHTLESARFRPGTTVEASDELKEVRKYFVDIDGLVKQKIDDIRKR